MGWKPNTVIAALRKQDTPHGHLGREKSEDTKPETAAPSSLCRAAKVVFASGTKGEELR